MKTLASLLTILILIACQSSELNNRNSGLITATAQQESIFESLISLTKTSIPETSYHDSLAFLILPVNASCPSCRKKTIEHIDSYGNTLKQNHYVIIADKGGLKSVKGYFKEVGKVLPDNNNRILIDSAELSSTLKLYSEQPTIYYTFNKKAFKKVRATPATVKGDLREFFEGQSSNKNL